MISDSDRPLAGVTLAVSVDDLFEWINTPRFDGYGFPEIVRALTVAFERHRIDGVYAFSNTAPVEDERSLRAVFDQWGAAGHFVGNHTHHHVNLNWLRTEDYLRDIERTEALIGNWLDRAPRRYFRHCFDSWGDTEARRDDVRAWLTRHGYAIAPVSTWFHDAPFSFAYARTLAARDDESRAYLRRRFVETAVDQLRTQAAAARLMFGREPTHIWLIHGTPIAADCIGAILDRFVELGVTFVPLDDAMADPMNMRQPVVTAEVRNQVQKWAIAKGVTVEQAAPDILAELDGICPVPGMSQAELMGRFVELTSASMGVRFGLGSVGRL